MATEAQVEPTALEAIGTPLARGKSTKAMMLGSGELGKEVAHRSYTFSMLDKDALRAAVEKEQPDFIIPEIEAIATDELLKLEAEGYRVVPTARAAKLTMDREGIRSLATEIGLLTSPYEWVPSSAAAHERLVVLSGSQPQRKLSTLLSQRSVKPCMSSSGKGQSVIKSDTPAEVAEAWKAGQEGGRAGAGRMIVEGFVDFEYEITLLTVDGDYRESWQPQQMSPLAQERAEEMARKVTTALGGWGLFGVEFFVKGDTVWFSEVSPRPHDTGMVTMISQDMPQFAIHARAILGLPITNIRQHGPSASAAILAKGTSDAMQFKGAAEALSQDDTNLRIFGKPSVDGIRRVAVGLARADNIEDARAKACHVRDSIEILYETADAPTEQEAAPAEEAAAQKAALLQLVGVSAFVLTAAMCLVRSLMKAK